MEEDNTVVLHGIQDKLAHFEDRWGPLPLLYAFWGAAPAEIFQFLLDSYHSLYPEQVFD